MNPSFKRQVGVTRLGQQAGQLDHHQQGHDTQVQEVAGDWSRQQATDKDTQFINY